MKSEFYSLHPRPADQLQIPPIGSNDSLSGHVYSVPITMPFTIFAHEMNFLQESGCGKFPWSRHFINPLLVIRSLPSDPLINRSSTSS